MGNKVLISVPPLLHKSVYLPYIWGRLKTYADCDYENDLSDIDWLDPLFLHETPDQLPECDILGLSCYVWNWDKNLEIAKTIKENNPNCFIIASGPHVPYKNSNFFEEFPQIDAICYSEGERVFSEFLYNYTNDIDYDIDGLLLKTNPTKSLPNVPKLSLDDLTSPWIHCDESFRRFDAELRILDKRVNIIIETNRGCPYKCAFCDWGSATNSKIKKFNKRNIFDEIDLLCKYDPEIVFIADANFGILEVDLEYIKRFVENKTRFDMRRMQVNVCIAKNKKDIANECLKLLYENEMLVNAQISFQHTDDEVLDIMDRSNIKVLSSIEEVKENYKNGIPSAGVLILGNPGDTMVKLKKAFNDLLCLGFHDEIRLHDFMLLPNAPASDPAYIEKWKIGYIEKMYQETPDRTPFKTKFLCESFSYTKKDYIEMQLYSSFIQSMHNLSIFKFVAMFAHHSHNVDYNTFYDQVIKIPAIRKILDVVEDDLNEYMYGDKQTKFITYNNRSFSYENYIFLKALENIDEIYDSFELYGSDIIKFQKEILVNGLPKNDFELDFDYKEYFTKIYNLPVNERGNFFPIKRKTKYKFKHYNVGPYENINTKGFTIKDVINKILNKTPNYRHKITYYENIIK